MILTPISSYTYLPLTHKSLTSHSHLTHIPRTSHSPISLAYLTHAPPSLLLPIATPSKQQTSSTTTAAQPSASSQSTAHRQRQAPHRTTRGRRAFAFGRRRSEEVGGRFVLVGERFLTHLTHSRTTLHPKNSLEHSLEGV
jgi:hypothetical protein